MFDEKKVHLRSISPIRVVSYPAKNNSRVEKTTL